MTVSLLHVFGFGAAPPIFIACPEYSTTGNKPRPMVGHRTGQGVANA